MYKMPQSKQQTPENYPSSEDKSLWSGKLVRLLTNLERYAWDILGIFCLSLALMTLVALFMPELSRGVLSWWTGILQLWLGWGSLWVVVTLASVGLSLLRRKTQGTLFQIAWWRILMLELAAFASLALLAVLGGSSFDRAEAGLDGGRIGWGLVLLLSLPFKSYGSASAWLIGLFASLVMLWGGMTGSGLLPSFVRWARKQQNSSYEPLAFEPMDSGISEIPLGNTDLASSPAENQRKRRIPLPPQFRKNFRVQVDNQEKPIQSIVRDEHLPSLDLLVNEPFNRPDERNINLTAGLIEKTLSEFGIPARVVGFPGGTDSYPVCC